MDFPLRDKFTGGYPIKKKFTIDQETNHIKYERNTPPQAKVENAKISVYVESSHHFNIFVRM